MKSMTSASTAFWCGPKSRTSTPNEMGRSRIRRIPEVIAPNRSAMAISKAARMIRKATIAASIEG
jgi:hypothetical protein